MAKRAATPLLVVLLCFGCDSASTDFRHEFYAFGTLVTIDLFDISPRWNATAMAAIEARIRSIDANWYPWREGELQQINSAIGRGESIKVSPLLADLLRRAATLEQMSGGRFNPTIGRLTELWGFHDVTMPRSLPPTDLEVREWLSLSVSSQSLEWDGNVLQSNSPDVMLDLGGIAKGSILEQFVGILHGAHVENAIINIGGDLTVMGQVNDRAARIGIRSPRSDDVLGWLELFDGETMMTSGDYERFFEKDGTRYQHVLDPRTGYPANQAVSASVVHDDPVLADAAATALLVAGPAEFDVLCALLDLEMAVIVTSSGDLRLTRAMEKRLHSIHH